MMINQSIDCSTITQQHKCLVFDCVVYESSYAADFSIISMIYLSFVLLLLNQKHNNKIKKLNKKYANA